MPKRSFDTHAYANQLEAAGVPRVQAEVQAHMLADIMGETAAIWNELGPLQARIMDYVAEVDIRIEERIDARVSKARGEIIHWMIGLLLVQAGGLFALFKMFS